MSDDIGEASYLFATPEQSSLDANNAGAIVSGLAKKGLAERTASSSFEGANGQVETEYPGWKLTKAGRELAGGLLTIPHYAQHV